MRWERLFADLSSQLEQAELDELQAEVAGRARIELGRLQLDARLGAAVGSSLTVTVPGVGPVSGRLADAGPDWIVVSEPVGREWLLATAAICAVRGLPLGARPEETTEAARLIARRLDLRRALRALARDRGGVRVHLVDGTDATGTLDRVGADHLDLAEHPAGEARRAAVVRSVLTVPLTALVAVSNAVGR